MPRAHRCFLPGYVWHLTHRCHKRSFLLRFAKDRRRWVQWLYQARKRYGLCVLNYIVTCNHIHLLVEDTGRDAIPRSMQLVAGRVAQEFNRRKGRQGAFWQDRYHATAIETDHHLTRCLTYIDLNMVRAGVVSDPRHWHFSGYHELLTRPRRYRIVDAERLQQLLGLSDIDLLVQARRDWVNEALESDSASTRLAMWTESTAVGSKSFAEQVAAKLKRGLELTPVNGAGPRRTYRVKDSAEGYKVQFCTENGAAKVTF